MLIDGFSRSSDRLVGCLAMGSLLVHQENFPALAALPYCSSMLNNVPDGAFSEWTSLVDFGFALLSQHAGQFSHPSNSPCYDEGL